MARRSSGYAANRLLTRGYADGKNDGFTYDAASRLTAETLRFTTGAETGIDLPVRYAYDADNRLTALTYPDGSVLNKAYTARNELAQVVDGAKPIATRVYDAGGRLVSTQYGNSLTETRTYVPGDTLVAGIAIPGVTGFAYAYDADRRKLAETDSEQASADQRFAYDSQDRLVSWKRGTGTAPMDPATATQTWNLSPVGDWTSTAIDGTTQLRTHTAVHELTAIGSTALAYDAKGNLTRDDQGQTFAWDPENRLAAAGSLHQGQGDSATYAYDALGRRVQKTVTTGATTVPSIFVNAGAQEVVEITGDLTALGDATADPEPAGAAPYNPGTGTGARGSLLADPFAQRCNAQPATTDTPDGWAADTGALAPTSADRGWSMAVAGVDRDHLGRPLYDSFLPLGASTWSIPVANGTHAVVIMCGDADSRQQTNHLLVNGVSVTDPTPYDGNVTLGYETGSFDGYALTVNVTGGLLTISADSGALNPKIDFIEIGATGSTIDAETTARVQAAATQATHDTAKGKAKTPPFVKRSIWGGSYVDELVSYSVKKPRKIATRYFAHSNHLYSVAAVTTATGSVVERWSYNAYGVPTIKNSANATIAKSAVGNDRGFTGYKLDNETGLYFARARMYSAKLGRFIGRDPLWNEDFHDIDMDMFGNGIGASIDGYNMYFPFFAPNSLDPTGLFAGWDHDEILQDGLSDSGLTQFDIDCLKKGSRWADRKEMQSDDNSHKHGMLPPGKTPQEAKDMTEKHIEDEMNAAADAFCSEGRNADPKSGMCGHLGSALHAVMDKDSPYHRTPEGDPIGWTGSASDIGKHLGEWINLRKNAAAKKKAAKSTKDAMDKFKQKICEKCPDKAPPGWCPPKEPCKK